MIKGRSKIQLFNAETGRTEFTAENTNLVTNAVSRLLNLKPEWAFTGGSITDIYRQLTPVCSKLMGGVLLWDDTITENANTVLPPAAVNNIGYAGGTYSGTNTMRGTLNQNESTAITNGYRFVWDFSTDKANGMIKCLSLTSRGGGNCGWNNASDAAVFACAPSQTESEYSCSAASPIAPVSIPAGMRLIGHFSADTYTVIGNSSNPTSALTIREINTVSASSFGMMTNLNAVGGNTASYTDYTVEGTDFPTSLDSWYVTEDFKLMSCAYVSTSTVKIHTIDIATKTLLSSQTLTTDTSGFTASVKNAFAYRYGYYYINNSTRNVMCKIAADGSLAADIALCAFSANAMTAHNLGDRLIFTRNVYSNVNNVSNVLTHTLCDGTNVTPVRSIYMIDPVYDCENVYPYYLSANFANRLIIRPYLATINNLAVPVEKNSTQTMKITYEIYNA